MQQVSQSYNVVCIAHQTHLCHIELNITDINSQQFRNSKLVIIGSGNGLAPNRRQAIIWTNADLSMIGPSENKSIFPLVLVVSKSVRAWNGNPPVYNIEFTSLSAPLNQTTPGRWVHWAETLTHFTNTLLTC